MWDGLGSRGPNHSQRSKEHGEAMRKLCVLIATGTAIALIAQTSGKAAPATTLDHYVFYKVKRSQGTTRFEKFGPVTLTDQFGSGQYVIVAPRQLGLPADKNGEGIKDPVTHLKEYKLVPVRGAKKFQVLTNVRVINQCNDLLVEVKKPFSILVPTNKDLTKPVEEPDPNLQNVDHFLCYVAKAQKKSAGTKLPKFPKGMQVDVQDQFQTRRYDLKKITKICTPAEKREDPNAPSAILSGPNKGDAKPIKAAGIRNPNDHLVCYRARRARKLVPQNGCGCDTSVDPKCKGTKITPRQPRHDPRIGIHVNNQFGPEQLDTKKELELCVPSLKGQSPPPLCGNGVVDAGEQCDPPDDAACPGLCQPDCRCGIEVDFFPDSEAVIDIITPLGSDTVVLRGPTRVHVDLGAMTGNPESVPTEIVSMELTGTSPLVGSVKVMLNPAMPSTGEIKEISNDTPGVLDLPPFTPAGAADSFFDVFFQVGIPDPTDPLNPPIVLHNLDPKHMTSIIMHKPPQEDEAYVNPDVIPLYDAAGNLTQAAMGPARQIPVPQQTAGPTPTPQISCTLLETTAGTSPVCGGSCPNVNDQCLFDPALNACQCVPPPEVCSNGSGGTCSGLCPGPQLFCKQAPSGAGCVCQE
ncbi:MAG: DUF6073 family protein [Candidatus Binatia bacterium]